MQTAALGEPMLRSPATAAVFLVLLAYYVVYYGVILHKPNHLKTEDIEPVPGAVS